VIFDAGTFAIAFAIALVLYPTTIRILRQMRSGQVIQEELPDSHQKKAGTPTGGGILFVAIAILGGVLATLAGHPGALPATTGLIAGGLIGFADDRSKLSLGTRGIPARLKLPIQLLLAIPVAWLATVQGSQPNLLPVTPWLLYPLAVLAIVGGVLQIPKVTDVLQEFLAPSFRDSRYYEELEPSGGLTWIGLLVGALLALGGIALAYRLWVAEPGRPAALRERLARVHGFLVRKWYFDELIDAAVVRPSAMFGRFARDVFERVVINGLIVGGPSGAVRAGSAAVRAVQSGFLRYYAALLLVGVTALGLYFLLAAS
jgi:hypothetical protein